MNARRTTLRAAGAAAAATALTGLSIGWAGPASAHVTITPSGTEAGSYQVLTFAFGHGCEGSPTRELAIQVPEPVISVAPTELAGWTVEKQMEQLDEPVSDGHGGEYTERVAQIVYTADTPVPDGYRAAMELSLQLPAEAAGETLAWPVVQRCAEGETGWTELAAEGQDPDELERPAPTVTLTEAGAEEAAATTTSATSEQVGQTGDPVAVDDEEGNNGVVLGLAGLVAGMAALVLAAMALMRTRRS